MGSKRHLGKLSPSKAREMIRTNEWTGPTAGISNGYTQANLVVVTKDLAYDLLLFCQRNPRPCPLLDVTEVGKPVPLMTAPGSDLRTDLPRYRIWKDGFLVDEPLDMTDYWRDDMVAFLLGCSFTFEGALLEAGIPVRHIEEGRNVPMYITNMECRRAGSLHGPMVVSMRPVPHSMVSRAVMITGRFPSVHGSPVHIGDPSVIGIREINDPDFGDRVTIKEGEVPVFWACGVTPQAALMKTRPPFAITHSPGHMFITDKRDLDYAIF